MRIDLGRFGPPVFTGRARGEAIRAKSGLDKKPMDEPVEVVIPEGTYAITSSFFLGLFGPSIRAAGSHEKFFGLFKFTGASHATIGFEDFVTRALRSSRDLV